MKVIKNKNRTNLTKAALGKIQCDLSIDNIMLVNQQRFKGFRRDLEYA